MNGNKEKVKPINQVCNESKNPDEKATVRFWKTETAVCLY